MTREKPVLHMLCGKIAAGKSTLAAKLASNPNTVLLTEDAWLKALYADQMTTPRDFMRCSAKLRAAIAPHIVALLDAGLSVVLDFQANTVESRTWMRQIIDQSEADHCLHVLDASDHVLLERLRARNAEGQHAFAATEEQFHQMSKFFVPPSAAEGFTLQRHDADD